MVKILNETRRRRCCPTRNARRCAFWGFEKIHIYTYRRVYRMCVLYIWGLSVSLLKRREKLWYRHRRLSPVYCRRIIKNPAEFSAR